ncbi:MAG: hypothetical protein IH949_11950 [Bacteroidetes bacterium]|nr:hypothetical protein [Bacteroidota bacterium]
MGLAYGQCQRARCQWAWQRVPDTTAWHPARYRTVHPEIDRRPQPGPNRWARPVAEPKAKGETKVSPDEEITDEVPGEGDDEDAGRDIPIYPHEIGEDDEPRINDPEENDNPEGYPPPAGLSDDVPDPEEVDADEVEAARRIKTFEDFVAEDGDSSTSTVIKKVRYSDDATELEDYGVPIAASADPMADVEEDYDGEKRGEDDEAKGDEDEDKGVWIKSEFFINSLTDFFKLAWKSK